MRTPGNRRLLLLLATTLTMFIQSFQSLNASPAAGRVAEFKLANGLQVVVVPDHRSPVVTHYVWYRVGSADEPPGVSGIAHFLEHLMFKSTDKIATGAFSKIVSRLGGQDNAFTTHDVTGYFQRISKDRLKTVMEMEADRMVNLKLTEKEVATEREVILEERRSRTENSPSSLLSEQMSAALYQNHPYRIPIIGWMHEMAKLSREDALAFYKRFYAPNNAIVIVAGDVTVEEVKALAEAAYGPLKPNPDIKIAAAAAGAPASRRAPRGAEGPARGQRLGAALLPGAQHAQRRGGRGRGALSAHEDPGQRHHQPALPGAGVGGENRLQRRRLVLGHRPRQRQPRPLRGGGPGRRPRQARGRHRPRPARGAREGRHGRRARARQEGLHRRFRLRIRQPERASQTLRRGHADRPDDRADQRLAGGHRQGDGRGRQARGRQAHRYPPLRDRQADPGARRSRKAALP